MSRGNKSLNVCCCCGEWWGQRETIAFYVLLLGLPRALDGPLCVTASWPNGHLVWSSQALFLFVIEIITFVWTEFLTPLSFLRQKWLISLATLMFLWQWLCGCCNLGQLLLCLSFYWWAVSHWTGPCFFITGTMKRPMRNSLHYSFRVKVTEQQGAVADGSCCLFLSVPEG